jgi:hypothetical protein
MFVVQATVTTVVNYDRNVFIVQWPILTFYGHNYATSGVFLYDFD